MAAALIVLRSCSSGGIFSGRNRSEGLRASHLVNSDQEHGFCLFVCQGAEHGTEGSEKVSII